MFSSNTVGKNGICSRSGNISGGKQMWRTKPWPAPAHCVRRVLCQPRATNRTYFLAGKMVTYIPVLSVGLGLSKSESLAQLVIRPQCEPLFKNIREHHLSVKVLKSLPGHGQNWKTSRVPPIFKGSVEC